MKSLIDRLLDETTTADVVPPLVVGTKVKQLKFKHKKEEKEGESRSKTESLIAGLTEDCPCDLIPDDAVPSEGEPIKGTEAPSTKIEAPDEAMTTLMGGEPQKESKPAEAKPQLESRDSIIHRMAMMSRTVKQREATDPTAQPAKKISEAEIIKNVAVETPAEEIPLEEEMKVKQGIAETLVSAETAGTPMPEHKPGDGSKIFGAFRKFQGG